MNMNFEEQKWVIKHPELFNNSNFIEQFLLNIRKAKHSLTILTDEFIEANSENMDVYSNPFFYELRDINNSINNLEKKINNLYDNTKHTYNIKDIDVLQTGGYIYVFVGQLDNGYWFSHMEDEIRIFDDMPFDPKDEDRDDYTWEKQHLIRILNPNKENKYLYEQMNNQINEFVFNEDLNKQFHNHFENILNDIEDKGIEK